MRTLSAADQVHYTCWGSTNGTGRKEDKLQKRQKMIHFLPCSTRQVRTEDTGVWRGLEGLLRPGPSSAVRPAPKRELFSLHSGERKQTGAVKSEGPWLRAGLTVSSEGRLEVDWTTVRVRTCAKWSFDINRTQLLEQEWHSNWTV